MPARRHYFFAQLELRLRRWQWLRLWLRLLSGSGRSGSVWLRLHLRLGLARPAAAMINSIICG
eukprot:COSAG04_NODE_10697_length_758_cov_1.135053_1_plen_62_part_10